MWPLLAWLFPSLMSDVTQSYLLAAEQRSGQALPGFVFPFLASGAAYGFGAGPEYALPCASVRVRRAASIRRSRSNTWSS